MTAQIWIALAGVLLSCVCAALGAAVAVTRALGDIRGDVRVMTNSVTNLEKFQSKQIESLQYELREQRTDHRNTIARVNGISERVRGLEARKHVNGEASA